MNDLARAVSRWVIALLFFVASPALAQTTGVPTNFSLVPKTPAAADCAVVDLAAEQMECADGVCTLDGAVELRCATSRLNADHVEIRYDEQQNFAGAHASGNVLYIRERHVITCQSMDIGADQIQGRIEHSTLRVKLVPADLSKPGMPEGRSVITFHGDIERPTEEHYIVRDGDFTLCDCGLNPPSWRVTAREIDATVGERATLWHPTFRLRPFQLFELPIPMPPMSLPLSRRAWGLLPPNPRFLGGRPLIDVPVFVPLGDSFDVTVIPGIRSDWAPNFGVAPNNWGAPRLGGRVRWAPTATWFGELNVDFTHDGQHGRSRTRNTLGGVAVNEAQQDASYDLVERVMLRGMQRATVAPNLDWAFDFNWVSDDLVLQDFATSIRDAASNYLPTRNELLYRPEGWSALAITDYFVVTNNSSATDYSNTKGRERSTMHRMPYLQVASNPLEVLPHVMVDANASFVRYGTLSGLQDDSTRSLSLGNGVVGIDYARKVSHFNVFARAASDTLLSSYVGETLGESQGAASTSLMLNARVDTRVSRRFGSYVHSITPRIEYKSIAAQGGEIPVYRSADDTAQVVYYDPRTQRRVFHQAQLAVDQALWGNGPLSALPLLNLSIRQPFDLETGKLLQTQVELAWRAPYFLTGNVRTSLAPGQDKVLRELSATANLNLRYASLGVGYARWQLNADRFIRSFYELAAPRTGEIANLRPIHTVSPNLTLNYKQRIFASYSTDYLLPIGDEYRIGPTSDYLNPDENPANQRSFVEHRVSIAYRSPCNCWGITTNMSFPDNERWFSNRRMNILFDVGGYTLGR